MYKNELAIVSIKPSTEEDDEKQVSEREHIEDDTLNDKLIDDDPGEEIITHYGDEQCVVSKFMKSNI